MRTRDDPWSGTTPDTETVGLAVSCLTGVVHDVGEVNMGRPGAHSGEMQAGTRQLESISPRLHEEKGEPSSWLDTIKRISTVAYLMLLACLAGYVPGWLAARGYEFEINDLRRQTQLNSIRTFLAEAALNVNRGEFEEARRNSSDFFTNLQAELDRDKPLFDAKDRGRLQDILARRDEVITNLARGDKATATILAGWYFTTDDFFDGR
jgi:hypothetical protein